MHRVTDCLKSKIRKENRQRKQREAGGIEEGDGNSTKHPGSKAGSSGERKTQ